MGLEIPGSEVKNAFSRYAVRQFCKVEDWKLSGQFWLLMLLNLEADKGLITGKSYGCQ